MPDFVGGAGGGGGLPPVEVLVGLVVGAGGGTLRPVICGLGITAPANLRIILKGIVPFATGGLGADAAAGPF